ncbi:MAG TPA: phosphoribosyltransferase family protein [Actinomycetota bacterium]|nr:phosphoribosyltransferase family protein [Actinomycetota bacterium]
MIFSDRREAGRKLGEALGTRPGALVLGIPRGGVVVAAEVAPRVEGTLDVVVPRKLGAPMNPELGIGAVAADGTTILDERLVRTLGVTDEYLAREVARQVEEIRRRTEIYRRGRPPLDVSGAECIVVDDGVATGVTAEVALRSLKRQNARTVVLAVPVAPSESVARLRAIADEIVCLEMPEPFSAVGQWYDHFPQVTDDEVLAALGDG